MVVVLVRAKCQYFGRNIKVSSEKPNAFREILKFSARSQSRFDNLRKRNDILRNNPMDIFTLFGTIDGIIRNNAVHCSEYKLTFSTEISIDSVEMSKEN